MCDVDHELVVRVSFKLRLEALSDLSAEFLFSLNSTLLEYLVEELLVEVSLLEALNLCNLEAEVRLKVLYSVLLNLEE